MFRKKSIENGATLKDLGTRQIKKFLEKGRGYYCWEQRKRKVKNQKLFRNYSSILARVLSTVERSARTEEQKRECLRGN